MKLLLNNLDFTDIKFLLLLRILYETRLKDARTHLEHKLLLLKL